MSRLLHLNRGFSSCEGEGKARRDGERRESRKSATCAELRGNNIWYYTAIHLGSRFSIAVGAVEVILACEDLPSAAPAKGLEALGNCASAGRTAQSTERPGQKKGARVACGDRPGGLRTVSSSHAAHLVNGITRPEARLPGDLDGARRIEVPLIIRDKGLVGTKVAR